jgi:hypothetical protein
MNDVTSTAVTTTTPEKSPRQLQIEALQARLAATRRPQLPTVRVVPKNDVIRKYIRHVPSGLRFPDEGAATWPMDTFTQRRLADGDITIEQAAPKAEGTVPRSRAVPPSGRAGE